jgi:hypothetical protein
LRQQGALAIHIRLLAAFDCRFNESPDCFGTGRKVELSAAPVVHHSQELLRDPHLKGTILGTARRATTRATFSGHYYIFGIDTNYGFAYVLRQAGGKRELATGPNPSHGDAPMAQAESITTAIRELMSRGQPQKSTNRLQAAHTEFIAALAGNAPRTIHSDTDCAGLESRADHLQKVFAALHVYISAIIAEIAEKIPRSTLDRRYLDELLRGLAAEALRVFRDAAAEMRGQENHRRAS